MRRILSAIVLFAVLLVPLRSAAAADETPVRSGTILSGVGWPTDHSLGGCELAPDCRAWLESGCDPVLTGRDPALMTSIEDVADLGGDGTPWVVEIRSGDPMGLRLGGASIQLWRQDCVELRDSRWVSWEPGACCEAVTRRPLLIPDSARWMTVSSAPHSFNIFWMLVSPAERSVDLVLRGHLRSRGAIVSDDATCESDVDVVIQRKGSTGWLEVGSTTTDADGAFALRLRDRSGRYRAIAPEASSSETTCVEALSATVRHRH